MAFHAIFATVGALAATGNKIGTFISKTFTSATKGLQNIASTWTGKAQIIVTFMAGNVAKDFAMNGPLTTREVVNSLVQGFVLGAVVTYIFSPTGIKHLANSIEKAANLGRAETAKGMFNVMIKSNPVAIASMHGAQKWVIISPMFSAIGTVLEGCISAIKGTGFKLDFKNAHGESTTFVAAMAESAVHGITQGLWMGPMVQVMGAQKMMGAQQKKQMLAMASENSVLNRMATGAFTIPQGAFFAVARKGVALVGHAEMVVTVTAINAALGAFAKREEGDTKGPTTGFGKTEIAILSWALLFMKPTWMNVTAKLGKGLQKIENRAMAGNVENMYQALLKTDMTKAQLKDAKGEGKVQVEVVLMGKKVAALGYCGLGGNQQVSKMVLKGFSPQAHTAFEAMQGHGFNAELVSADGKTAQKLPTNAELKVMEKNTKQQAKAIGILVEAALGQGTKGKGKSRRIDPGKFSGEGTGENRRIRLTGRRLEVVNKAAGTDGRRIAANIVRGVRQAHAQGEMIPTTSQIKSLSVQGRNIAHMSGMVADGTIKKTNIGLGTVMALSCGEGKTIPVLLSQLCFLNYAKSFYNSAGSGMKGSATVKQRDAMGTSFGDFLSGLKLMVVTNTWTNVKKDTEIDSKGRFKKPILRAIAKFYARNASGMAESCIHVIKDGQKHTVNDMNKALKSNGGKGGGIYFMSANAVKAVYFENAKMLKGFSGLTIDEVESVFQSTSLTMATNMNFFAEASSGTKRVFRGVNGLTKAMGDLMMKVFTRQGGMESGLGKMFEVKDGKIMFTSKAGFESMANHIIKRNGKALARLGGNKALAKSILLQYANRATHTLLSPTGKAGGFKIVGMSSKTGEFQYDMLDGNGDIMLNTRYSDSMTSLAITHRSAASTRYGGSGKKVTLRGAYNTFKTSQSRAVTIFDAFNYINTNNRYAKNGTNSIMTGYGGTIEGCRQVLNAMDVRVVDLGTSKKSAMGDFEIFTNTEQKVRAQSNYMAKKLFKALAAGGKKVNMDTLHLVLSGSSVEAARDYSGLVKALGSYAKTAEGKALLTQAGLNPAKFNAKDFVVQYKDADAAEGAMQTAKAGGVKGLKAYMGKIHVVGKLITGSNLLGTAYSGNAAEQGYLRDGSIESSTGKVFGIRRVEGMTTGVNTSSNMIQQAARGNVKVGKKAYRRADMKLKHFVDVNDMPMSSTTRADIVKLIADGGNKGTLDNNAKGAVKNVDGKVSVGNRALVKKVWQQFQKYNARVDGQQATQVVEIKMKANSGFNFGSTPAIINVGKMEGAARTIMSTPMVVGEGADAVTVTWGNMTTDQRVDHIERMSAKNGALSGLNATEQSMFFGATAVDTALGGTSEQFGAAVGEAQGIISGLTDSPSWNSSEVGAVSAIYGAMQGNNDIVQGMVLGAFNDHMSVGEFTTLAGVINVVGGEAGLSNLMAKDSATGTSAMGYIQQKGLTSDFTTLLSVATPEVRQHFANSRLDTDMNVLGLTGFMSGDGVALTRDTVTPQHQPMFEAAAGMLGLGALETNAGIQQFFGQAAADQYFADNIDTFSSLLAAAQQATPAPLGGTATTEGAPAMAGQEAGFPMQGKAPKLDDVESAAKHEKAFVKRAQTVEADDSTTTTVRVEGMTVTLNVDNRADNAGFKFTDSNGVSYTGKQALAHAAVAGVMARGESPSALEGVTIVVVGRLEHAATHRNVDGVENGIIAVDKGTVTGFADALGDSLVAACGGASLGTEKAQELRAEAAGHALAMVMGHEGSGHEARGMDSSTRSEFALNTEDVGGLIAGLSTALEKTLGTTDSGTIRTALDGAVNAALAATGQTGSMVDTVFNAVMGDSDVAEAFMSGDIKTSVSGNTVTISAASGTNAGTAVKAAGAIARAAVKAGAEGTTVAVAADTGVLADASQMGGFAGAVNQEVRNASGGAVALTSVSADVGDNSLNMNLADNTVTALNHETGRSTTANIQVDGTMDMTALADTLQDSVQGLRTKMSGASSMVKSLMNTAVQKAEGAAQAMAAGDNQTAYQLLGEASGAVAQAASMDSNVAKSPALKKARSSIGTAMGAVTAGAVKVSSSSAVGVSAKGIQAAVGILRSAMKSLGTQGAEQLSGAVEQLGKAEQAIASGDHQQAQQHLGNAMVSVARASGENMDIADSPKVASVRTAMSDAMSTVTANVGATNVIANGAVAQGLTNSAQGLSTGIKESTIAATPAGMGQLQTVVQKIEGAAQAMTTGNTGQARHDVGGADMAVAGAVADNRATAQAPAVTSARNAVTDAVAVVTAEAGASLTARGSDMSAAVFSAVMGNATTAAAVMGGQLSVGVIGETVTVRATAGTSTETVATAAGVAAQATAETGVTGTRVNVTAETGVLAGAAELGGFVGAVRQEVRAASAGAVGLSSVNANIGENSINMNLADNTVTATNLDTGTTASVNMQSPVTVSLAKAATDLQNGAPALRAEIKAMGTTASPGTIGQLNVAAQKAEGAAQAMAAGNRQEAHQLLGQAIGAVAQATDGTPALAKSPAMKAVRGNMGVAMGAVTAGTATVSSSSAVASSSRNIHSSARTLQSAVQSLGAEGQEQLSGAMEQMSKAEQAIISGNQGQAQQHLGEAMTSVSQAVAENAGMAKAPAVAAVRTAMAEAMATVSANVASSGVETKAEVAQNLGNSVKALKSAMGTNAFTPGDRKVLSGAVKKADGAVQAVASGNTGQAQQQLTETGDAVTRAVSENADVAKSPAVASVRSAATVAVAAVTAEAGAAIAGQEAVAGAQQELITSVQTLGAAMQNLSGNERAQLKGSIDKADKAVQAVERGNYGQAQQLMTEAVEGVSQARAENAAVAKSPRVESVRGAMSGVTVMAARATAVRSMAGAQAQSSFDGAAKTFSAAVQSLGGTENDQLGNALNQAISGVQNVMGNNAAEGNSELGRAAGALDQAVNENHALANSSAVVDVRVSMADMITASGVMAGTAAIPDVTATVAASPAEAAMVAAGVVAPEAAAGQAGQLMGGTIASRTTVSAGIAAAGEKGISGLTGVTAGTAAAPQAATARVQVAADRMTSAAGTLTGAEKAQSGVAAALEKAAGAVRASEDGNMGQAQQLMGEAVAGITQAVAADQTLAASPRVQATMAGMSSMMNEAGKAAAGMAAPSAVAKTALREGMQDVKEAVGALSRTEASQLSTAVTGASRAVEAAEANDTKAAIAGLEGAIADLDAVAGADTALGQTPAVAALRNSMEGAVAALGQFAGAAGTTVSAAAAVTADTAGTRLASGMQNLNSAVQQLSPAEHDALSGTLARTESVAQALGSNNIMARIMAVAAAPGVMAEFNSVAATMADSPAVASVRAGVAEIMNSVAAPAAAADMRADVPAAGVEGVAAPSIESFSTAVQALSPAENAGLKGALDRADKGITAINNRDFSAGSAEMGAAISALKSAIDANPALGKSDAVASVRANMAAVVSDAAGAAGVEGTGKAAAPVRRAAKAVASGVQGMRSAAGKLAPAEKTQLAGVREKVTEAAKTLDRGDFVQGHAEVRTAIGALDNAIAEDLSLAASPAVAALRSNMVDTFTAAASAAGYTDSAAYTPAATGAQSFDAAVKALTPGESAEIKGALDQAAKGINAIERGDVAKGHADVTAAVEAIDAAVAKNEDLLFSPRVAAVRARVSEAAGAAAKTAGMREKAPAPTAAAAVTATEAKTVAASTRAMWGAEQGLNSTERNRLSGALNTAGNAVRAIGNGNLVQAYANMRDAVTQLDSAVESAAKSDPAFAKSPRVASVRSSMVAARDAVAREGGVETRTVSAFNAVANLDSSAANLDAASGRLSRSERVQMSHAIERAESAVRAANRNDNVRAQRFADSAAVAVAREIEANPALADSPEVRDLKARIGAVQAAVADVARMADRTEMHNGMEFGVKTDLERNATDVTSPAIGMRVGIRSSRGRVEPAAISAVMEAMSSVGNRMGSFAALGRAVKGVEAAASEMGGAGLESMTAVVGENRVDIAGGFARITDMTTGRSLDVEVSALAGIAGAEARVADQMNVNNNGHVREGQSVKVKVADDVTCDVKRPATGKMTVSINGGRDIAVHGTDLLGALEQALRPAGHEAAYDAFESDAIANFGGKIVRIETRSAIGVDGTVSSSSKAGVERHPDGSFTFSSTGIEKFGAEGTALRKEHNHPVSLSLAQNRAEGFRQYFGDIAERKAVAAFHGISTDALAPMRIKEIGQSGHVEAVKRLVSSNGAWRLERLNADTKNFELEHQFTEQDIAAIDAATKTERDESLGGGARILETTMTMNGQTIKIARRTVRNEVTGKNDVSMTVERSISGALTQEAREAAADMAETGTVSADRARAVTSEALEPELQPPSGALDMLTGTGASARAPATAAARMRTAGEVAQAFGAAAMVLNARQQAGNAVDAAMEWLTSAVQIQGYRVASIDVEKLAESLDSEKLDRLNSLLAVEGIGQIEISDAGVDDIIGSLRFARQMEGEGVDMPVFTIENGNSIVAANGGLKIAFKSARYRRHYDKGELSLTGEMAGVLASGDVAGMADVLPSILHEKARHENSGWHMDTASANALDAAKDRVVEAGADVAERVVREAVSLGADESSVRQEMGMTAKAGSQEALARMRAADQRILRELAGKAIAERKPTTTPAVHLGAASGMHMLAAQGAQPVIKRMKMGAETETTTREDVEAEDKIGIGKVRAAVAGSGFTMTVVTADGKAEIDISRRDMLELAKAVGSSLNRILKEGMALNKDSYVYLVDLSVTDNKTFARTVGTFSAINASLGRPQFRVVAVGAETASTRIENIARGMTDGTLDYSSVSRLAEKLSQIEDSNKIIASGEGRETGGMHKTGIAGEDASPGIISAFRAVCDVFVKADSFGEALVLAITASDLDAQYTEAAQAKLAAMVKDAKKKGVKDEKAAVISFAGARDADTEEEIDNYLFGGIYADTQF